MCARLDWAASNNSIALSSFPDCVMLYANTLPSGDQARDVGKNPTMEAILRTFSLYYPRGANYLSAQVGFLSYPRGRFRPITRDTNNYESLTVSADGNTLATVQAKYRTSISFFPGPHYSQPAIPTLDTSGAMLFASRGPENCWSQSLTNLYVSLLRARTR